MIDLHTHSSASDGEYSPSNLIFLAAEKGLDVIALTDHDTVSGLEEAEAAAASTDITFVKGIELNINRSRGEFHLLGLGLKDISPSMRKITDTLQQERDERNRNMVEAMQKDGFPVSYAELEEMFPEQILGRPHFAAYLVKKGVVRKRQQAFDRYIGQGRPYYRDRQGAVLEDAVEAIEDCGGIPVIAHPLSLYISWGKMEGTLRDIYDCGVKGLEAWHPGAKPGSCRRLEKMAREIGFFITAGSDFHGEAVRADRKLGHTAGKAKIDDRYWTQELLPAINRGK